ncbi:WYL domain-containing protein [Cohnella boryungensis]|uniref:WYL domain-containing protein n=1 Tax=Cohnella boryungensis TaxID=768479 RepID=A0ABV8SDG9_9BACL
MNPFEKIFNYQIISRLDESDAIALTSQERAWLRSALAHGASSDAFTAETLAKLKQLLQDEADIDHSRMLVEKAKSAERQVYHPLLRTLRRLIMQGKGMLLTSRIKHGGTKNNQSGLPFKLEYSMVKREWYLLWYSARGRSLMSTKLQSIVSIEETSLPAERAEAWRSRMSALLEARRERTVIEVIRTYNAELSRILYAFSCFDKSVQYDEETNLYRIHLSYLADESEFLLSRIRFLGLRVKLVEGDGLRRRMRESAEKALERYGMTEHRDKEG